MAESNNFYLIATPQSNRGKVHHVKLVLSSKLLCLCGGLISKGKGGHDLDVGDENSVTCSNCARIASRAHNNPQESQVHTIRGTAKEMYKMREGFQKLRWLT